MRTLKHASDVLSFGEIGEVCTLGDIYRHTNLDPARPTAADEFEAEILKIRPTAGCGLTSLRLGV